MAGNCKTREWLKKKKKGVQRPSAAPSIFLSLKQIWPENCASWLARLVEIQNAGHVLQEEEEK